MVAPTEVSWFMERTVEFSLRLGHARVLTSHRDVIHCARAASLRRSLHAYLNVIIDLLDDRFLTAKQTNSTIHCRDWRPRQSAKANGSSKPLPYEYGSIKSLALNSAFCTLHSAFNSPLPSMVVSNLLPLIQHSAFSILHLIPPCFLEVGEREREENLFFKKGLLPLAYYSHII